MKTIKSFLLIITLLLGVSDLYGQTTELNAITNAIKIADTKTIYDYCENSIILNIPSANGKYSKTQARKILDQFFKDKPAKEIKFIKNQSKNQNEYYSIIEYKSEKQSLNFFVEIKRVGTSFLIQKIQILEIKP
ncbi:MAG: DUF4783 domain-containing protein [Bacteroidetes bacterium]|nr:DUF4783 domain-containing protein [Bacteroidota bacterium]